MELADPAARAANFTVSSPSPGKTYPTRVRAVVGSTLSDAAEVLAGLGTCGQRVKKNPQNSDVFFLRRQFCWAEVNALPLVAIVHSWTPRSQ